MTLKKSYIILIVLSLSLICIGCLQTKEMQKDKIDPFLAKKLSELEQKNSNELIDFIGRGYSEITTAMKDDIKASNINIHSISKDIFTATGNFKAIIKIAGKDYIKWLEASRKLYPLNNN